MIQRISIKLGTSDNATAGPLVDGVFLRIEGRGRGAVIIEMNEFMADDIVDALLPHSKKRN